MNSAPHGSTTDEQPLYLAPPWEPHKTLAWLEKVLNVQSMLFMTDLLPVIRQLLAGWPSDQPVRVLDVGTGAGAGANLLGELYSGAYPPLMQVDAIDIAGSYLAEYARAKFRYINYIVGDALQLPAANPWDLVICSHTIEHIDEPFAFMAALQRLARHWVLMYAPWNEQQLVDGHQNSIDEEYIRRTGATSWKTIDSRGWGPCVYFVLPGSAA
ncbi:MAG TPA: class I SAM-dependent methyltransferase [Bryobacteraceae bacterium]|nr:class I SAM-dependent methyltransferase [Bryobacteraceae bacterium]